MGKLGFQLPMDQLPIDTPKGVRGGDTRTPQAKVDIAKRENQIVELRLRNISFAAIGRAVGVSKVSAIKAFYKALHRNTDRNISVHHRSELAKLEMEETRLWQALDTHKESWQATATCMNGLNRIHVRRAHLLGSMHRPNSTSVASTSAAATSYRTSAAKPNGLGSRCHSRSRPASMTHLTLPVN